MGKLRKVTQKRGWAYTLCIAILEPILQTLTRRHWVDGLKLPAEGGVVVAANHISHLDPLTFAHFAYYHGRLPRFLAKAELFDAPVVGPIVRNARQIPVYRLSTDASRAFDAAVQSVRDGECVVVYPEGTITRDPDLWPMVGKTGAARIALSTDAPVIPVAQWGAQEILAPYGKKPRIFPLKTIRVKAGDPVDLDDLRDLPLTPEVLHQATGRIMDDVTRLLEDLRNDHAPATRFDPRAAGVREIGNPRSAQQRAPRARRSREGR